MEYEGFNLERRIMENGLKSFINEQKQMEAARKKGIRSTYEKIAVPARDGKTVDVYFFKSRKDGKSPAMFHIHGGAFVWGDAELDYKYCEKIRDDLGMNVISIQYRLAPDNSYPGQTNDCYDAIAYFYNNADKYHLDKDKFVVSGISAGGNLAAIVCMMAKETGKLRIASQVLMYPYLDLASEPRSKPTPEGAYSSEWDDRLVGLGDLYSKAEQRALKYISPVCANPDDLKDLPQAIVITAEYDTLCTEGQKYAEMLKQAGVAVYSETYRGATHGFIDLGLDTDYMNIAFPYGTPQAVKDSFAAMANAAMQCIEKQLAVQIMLSK